MFGLENRLWRIAFALGVATIATAPVGAVTFHLVDKGGAPLNSPARRGFEAAASYWSSVLTDKVNLNIDLEFKSMDASSIAVTDFASGIYYNADVYKALAADRRSDIDRAAVASLPLLGASSAGNTALAFTANALNKNQDGYVRDATRFDNDGSLNNVSLVVTQANAKALGMGADINGHYLDPNGVDATLIFNDQYDYDFDPRDGIDRDRMDFIGTAIHEIGHALGFISGADYYDFYTAPGSGVTYPGALETDAVLTTLDYFRYGAPGQIDLSSSATPYFSIDGGVSELLGGSAFATGVANGDGYSASHWKEGPRDRQYGTMDPASDFGDMDHITALDLAAFDAIGWDVKFDVLAHPEYRYSTASVYRDFLAAAVPEPASWALMILGFGMVGAAARHRPRPVVRTA